MPGEPEGASPPPPPGAAAPLVSIRPETAARGRMLLGKLGGATATLAKGALHRMSRGGDSGGDSGGDGQNPQRLRRGPFSGSGWMVVPILILLMVTSVVIMRGPTSSSTPPIKAGSAAAEAARRAAVVPAADGAGGGKTRKGKKKGRRAAPSPKRMPYPVDQGGEGEGEGEGEEKVEGGELGAAGSWGELGDEVAAGAGSSASSVFPPEEGEEGLDGVSESEGEAAISDLFTGSQVGGAAAAAGGMGTSDGLAGLSSPAAAPSPKGFPWPFPAREPEPFKAAAPEDRPMWEQAEKDRAAWLASWRSSDGNPKKLPGTALACKCGADGCASYDEPDVSYVLAEAETMEEVTHAIDLILQAGGTKEVVVRSNGAMPHDELMQQVARASAKGYRGEVLERGAIAYGPKIVSAEEGAAALERFSTGKRVVRVPGGAPAVLPEPVARPRDRGPAAGNPFRSREGKSKPLAVSFVIQYFRRPSLITRIIRNLRGYGAELDVEVLVNNDSNSEHEEILHALEGGHVVLGGGTRYWQVHCGNTHEIRGYNRLTLMARSEVVMLLQDDDVPTPRPNLAMQAASLMLQHPKLGLLGSMNGQIQGGPGSGRYGKARGRHVRPIAGRDHTGKPFMFVSWVNMGPFVIRRSAFIKAGQFKLDFSCRGDPGIGFDYEYGIRMWKQGFEVGLAYSGFRMHAGSSSRASGTRSNSAMKNRRDRIEKRNTQKINALYKGFYVNHTPEGANKDARGKSMSVSRVCAAARLPTLANRRLRK